MSPTKQTATRKTGAAGKPSSTASSRARSTKAQPEGSSVEIKIGIQHTPREIVLDVDQDADQIAKALADATAKGGTLIISDVKGRRVLLPADKVAYIEIGEPEARRVGFGTT